MTEWGCVGSSSPPPPALWGGRVGTDVAHMLPCDCWHCQSFLLWVVQYWASDTGEYFLHPFLLLLPLLPSPVQPLHSADHCISRSLPRLWKSATVHRTQQTPLSWAGQWCPDPDDCSARGADGQCRLHRDSAFAPPATRLTLSAALTIIYSLLPATAHLPLATMQAQDCSHLLTEDIYLPRLTCPCIIQARDSHQPTDAICQHLSAIDKSICQPSPPTSHLRSTYQHELHLPLTTTSPLYATCGLYVCKALSYLC